MKPIDDSMDYDCVDIYKQPSFNHPLLKNHKIQMEPSFQLESKKSSSRGEGCPKGKVPIKRMNDSDIFDRFHQFSSEHPGEHFATLDTSVTTTYRGAAAFISNHDPPAKMGQVSMAQIWLQNGPPNELNNIQAGWAVHPKIYGDSRAYFTAFWTADGHKKTGCYNVLCPGFVQVDNKFYTGKPLTHISVYKGQEYAINMKILQDKTSGHWWLMLADRKVGYWPKELFNHLNEGAIVIRYGGRTTSGPDGTSPPMGSGVFANRFNDESSFFSRMRILNSVYEENDIPTNFMKVNTDTLNCYSLDYWGYQSHLMGQILTYGGPGGNCGV